MTVEEILIERNGMTPREADEYIDQSLVEINDRLNDGEDIYNLCEELFGLTPDYLMEYLPN